MCCVMIECICFFFNDTATTEIYTYLHTLSLHDALPISAVVLARDLHPPEAAEVRRGELGIEELEAAPAQAQHELGEGDLAGIGRPAEHRLAEEGPAQRHAIEPADQGAVAPALDGVGEAHVEELVVELLDDRVDPGVGPVLGRLRAAANDLLEGGVAAHLEDAAADLGAQLARQAEVVERQDAAHVRIDPVQLWVDPALGHGEDPDGISAEEEVRR